MRTISAITRRKKNENNIVKGLVFASPIGVFAYTRKGGEFMGGESNLKKFTSDQSREKAVENGRKGGKASGRAKRTKKNLREALKALLEAKIKTDDGTLTGTEAIALKAFQGALNGDWKAWELVRDTSGQKPIDKVATAEVDPDVLAEIDRIVREEE